MANDILNLLLWTINNLFWLLYNIKVKLKKLE